MLSHNAESYNKSSREVTLASEAMFCSGFGNMFEFVIGIFGMDVAVLQLNSVMTVLALWHSPPHQEPDDSMCRSQILMPAHIRKLPEHDTVYIKMLHLLV